MKSASKCNSVNYFFSPHSNSHIPYSNIGFTIVELLVVIVVIGILAAITIVSYTGLSNKATVSSLQSDLSTAKKQLNLYYVDHSAYPASIDTTTKCPLDSSSVADNRYCLKLSTGNNLIGYSSNNSSSSQSFLLIASNTITSSPNSLIYKVTNTSSPTQLASTMQPGATPGAVLELNAAKANGGSSPGINSPFTTTWTDTSGNNNNGTLTNFGVQTPWGGVGTTGDPYKLTFDGVDDWVTVIDNVALRPGTGDYSLELWLTAPWGYSSSYPVIYAKGWSSSAAIGGWGIDGLGTQTTILNMQDAYVAGTYNMNSVITGSLSNGLHHVIVTRASGVYRSYVDGILYGSPVTPAHIADLNSTANLRIGSSALDARQMGTNLSLVRQYPFALSANQAAANYTAKTTW
jgi:general secretion pathway protein G